MAIDGVPLWIGGDEARHSAELLRLQNWMIYRGQEGFLTADAGRCVELATPGEGVRLLPGPFVINSRFPNGAYQSYISNIINDEIVQTTIVPPGDGRSDLVVLNVEDPYPNGGTVWPLPADAETRQFGPYIRARVVEGVPASCVALSQLPADRTERTWTALASARLDRPANTGTVTQDMIKPVNAVLNPWSGISIPDEILELLSGDLQLGIPPESTDQSTCIASSANTLLPNQSTFKRFPAETHGTYGVPNYANWCEMWFEIIGVLHTNSVSGGSAQFVGSAAAQMQAFTGDQEFVTAPFRQFILEDFNPLEGTGTKLQREFMKFPFEFPVPTSFRGQPVGFDLKMNADTANSFGQLIADNKTVVNVYIKFKETPYGA